MFTGLVEEVGRIRQVRKQGQTMVLTVEGSVVMDDMQLGDSLAVNGVCLTVVAFDRSSVAVDVMPETYRRTNLRMLGPGSRVNLERAMNMKRRFGGHLVQGHADGTGIIAGRTAEENAVVFRIRPDQPSMLRYVIPQGSIAVDGISLTVSAADDSAFSVSIIPHTLAHTALADRHSGDTVNLEYDLLGKYVERLLAFRQPDAGMAEGAHAFGSSGRGLTKQFLTDHGFS